MEPWRGASRRFRRPPCGGLGKEQKEIAGVSRSHGSSEPSPWALLRRPARGPGLLSDQRTACRCVIAPSPGCEGNPDTAGQASRGTGKGLLCHGRLVRPWSCSRLSGVRRKPGHGWASQPWHVGEVPGGRASPGRCMREPVECGGGTPLWRGRTPTAPSWRASSPALECGDSFAALDFSRSETSRECAAGRRAPAATAPLGVKAA